MVGPVRALSALRRRGLAVLAGETGTHEAFARDPALLDRMLAKLDVTKRHQERKRGVAAPPPVPGHLHDEVLRPRDLARRIVTGD